MIDKPGCVFVVHVSLRSYRISWKQKQNIPGSYRVFWVHTCARFTPQTGAVIFSLLFFYSRVRFQCSHTRIPIIIQYVQFPLNVRAHKYTYSGCYITHHMYIVPSCTYTCSTKYIVHQCQAQFYLYHPLEINLNNNKVTYFDDEWLLSSSLRSSFFRLSSVDISYIQGNLEEISTFQQMLVQSLEEHTKSVDHHCLCTTS